MPRTNPLIAAILESWNSLSSFHKEERYTETKEDVRRLLSFRPTQEVQQVLFGRDSDVGKHPLIARIKSEFQDRWTLLAWVYGDSTRAIEARYVRLPSIEKRTLAKELVQEMKERYRWFKSPLLHAYAFRPSSFKARDDDTRQLKQRWGALYQRVEIARRPGEPRVLYVPTPPLKHLQRIILEKTLAKPLESLSSSVMGCRPNVADKKYGIYQNASRHLGQEYVAQFDLKDFFPSIDVGSIIRMLAALKTRMLRVATVAGNFVDVPWTHDSAVLVARLVTRYGRLPQGSPTSPAIANLVFGPFDAEINKLIGSGICYTRYVDDLTFSIAKGNARRLEIGSAQQFQDTISNCLERVLEDSPFRLNARKTKCSALKNGHVITGLSVTRDQVNIPSKTRKRLRVLVHRISCTQGARSGTSDNLRDFASVAEQFCREEQRNVNRHEIENSYAKYESGINKFLKHSCPGLVTEFHGFAASTIRGEPRILKGSKAVNLAAKLLALTWSSHLEMRNDAEDENKVTLTRHGKQEPAFTLSCRENIGVFSLSRRQFMSSLFLWMHLRGWLAALSPSHFDECFTRLLAFRGELQGAMQNIHFRGRFEDSLGRNSSCIPSEQATEDRAESEVRHALALDRDIDRLQENLDTIVRQVQLLTRYITENQQIDLLNRKEQLQVIVSSKEQLSKQWLPQLEQLWLTIPLQKDPFNEREWLRIQRMINVLIDRMLNLRMPTYVIEKEICSEAECSSPIDSVSDADLGKIQVEVLRQVSSVLAGYVKFYERLEQESWSNQFIQNKHPPQEDLRERLRLLVNELTKIHDKCKWRSTGQPMFSVAAVEKLQTHLKDLRGTIDESAHSEAVWAELFRFALILVQSTFDEGSFEGDELTLSPQARSEVSTKKITSTQRMLIEELKVEIEFGFTEFLLLKGMRNRSAHVENASRQSDWLNIQTAVAQKLGRYFKANRKAKKHMKQSDDLKLSPLEGTELKEMLLKSVVEALRPLSGEGIRSATTEIVGTDS